MRKVRRAFAACRALVVFCVKVEARIRKIGIFVRENFRQKVDGGD